MAMKVAKKPFYSVQNQLGHLGIMIAEFLGRSIVLAKCLQF